jgi:hypothetical protein
LKISFAESQHQTKNGKSYGDLWLMVCGKHDLFVGFEVLTAAVMKGTVFWDITPCSPLKIN